MTSLFVLYSSTPFLYILPLIKIPMLLIPVLHLGVYTFGICLGKHSRLVRRHCYFRTLSHTVKSNQIGLKMIPIYFNTIYIDITPGYSSKKTARAFPRGVLTMVDSSVRLHSISLSEVIKLLLPHSLTRVNFKSLSLPNLSTSDICDLFTQRVKPIPS